MQIVDLQDDNVAERSVITKRESLKTDSWVHELIDLLHGQNESDFLNVSLIATYRLKRFGFSERHEACLDWIFF